MVHGLGTQGGNLGTNPPPEWIELLEGWFHKNGDHHYSGYIVQTRSVKQKRRGWNGHILITARQDLITELASDEKGITLCTMGLLPLGGISKLMLRN